MKHMAVLSAPAFLVIFMQVFAAEQQLSTQEIICTLAPSQSAAVNRLSVAVGGAGATAYALGQATGLTAVAHSSGALILTGSGGYVTGTLLGGAAAIAAPVIIGVALVVGGTALTVELLCAPKNYPEAVGKINGAAVELMRRSKLKFTSVKDVTTTYFTDVSAKIKNVAGDVYADAYSRLPVPAKK